MSLLQPARLLPFVALVALCGAVAALPRSTSAAYPGENGQIVFSKVNTLYVVNPDGSGEESLEVDGQDPSWSPNGHKIAFWVSNDIWVINSDGSDLTNVSDTGAEVERYPTWSPDGLRIVYQRADDLWVMNADGSGQEPLLEMEGVQSEPEWSPLGDKIAFQNVLDIWVVDADGTNPVNITNVQLGETFNDPTWSPNGEQIAYAGMENSIWVMNADGTGREKVTDLPLNVATNHPAWSPDGTKIAFQSPIEAAQPYEIAIVDVQSGDVDGATDDGASNARPNWQPLPTEEPVDLFEGFTQVTWEGRDVEGVPSVLVALNAYTTPSAWLSVSHFEDGVWLQAFRSAPLPAFNTLKELRPDGMYWIFATEFASLTFP